MLASTQGSTWRKGRKEARGWASPHAGSWQRSPTTCSRSWTWKPGVEVPLGGAGADLGGIASWLRVGQGLALGVASLQELPWTSAETRGRARMEKRIVFLGLAVYWLVSLQETTLMALMTLTLTDLSPLSGSVRQTSPQAKVLLLTVVCHCLPSA